MRREVEEETGAHDIKILRDFGYIEEYRPFWKPEYDVMHMTSHFFVCDVARELREAKMESYEHANGMRPVWVDLREALAHNRDVMLRQDSKMGLSIQRETFMLETVEQELFCVLRYETLRTEFRASRRLELKCI